MANTANLARDPVGVGIKLPLTFANGRLQLTATTRIRVTPEDGISDSEANTVEVLVSTDLERRRVVVNSMKRILRTPLGARWMEGAFGSEVDLLPFEPNDETTHHLLLWLSTGAISQLEPRVVILSANAAQSANQPERINALLTYRIRSTEVVATDVVLERGMDT